MACRLTLILSSIVIILDEVILSLEGSHVDPRLWFLGLEAAISANRFRRAYIYIYISPNVVEWSHILMVQLQ